MKKDSLTFTQLMTRRQSELIDNPWFSALLTTPCKAPSPFYNSSKNRISNSLDYFNTPITLKEKNESLTGLRTFRLNKQNVGARLAQSNLINSSFHKSKSCAKNNFTNNSSNNTNISINNKKAPLIFDDKEILNKWINDRQSFNKELFLNNNKIYYRSGYAPHSKDIRRHTLANIKQSTAESYKKMPLKYIEYDSEMGCFYHSNDDDQKHSASTISYVDEDAEIA